MSRPKRRGRCSKITPALGVIFRSRLECRVACTLSAIGVDWRYEPRTFKIGKKLHYLPDFFCNYQGENFWLEVKPTPPTRQEIRKACGVALQSPYPILVSTNDPFYSRIFNSLIYWSDDGRQICWDSGRFIDFLGLRYSEFEYRLAEAREAYRSLNLAIDARTSADPR